MALLAQRVCHRAAESLRHPGRAWSSGCASLARVIPRCLRSVSTRTGTRGQFLCPIFVGNCDGILEQLLRATGEPLGAVMRGSIGRRWRAQHAVQRF